MYFGGNKLRSILLFELREANEIQFGLSKEVFDVFPGASLFMTCNEGHNLWMNRESLDRESLDCI